MASTIVHDTLISGYLAVKGLSIVNKQSKIVTVIKKWQQLWVVLGQANTSQWLLVIYQHKSYWLHAKKPLAIHQIIHLHSFTDKQTNDGLHMFLLKFSGGHKISFACSSQKQKSEWLTAIQEALNACYNKKQPRERHTDEDDWWQLSEHQENTPEYKEFQVAVANCSLTENINRCRVCVFHSQSYMAVYGYSTYSSYTTQWTWKYSQLYCINFSEQTLTVQLHISDSLEEICWTGKETLQLYNILCNISGVWDCTMQASDTAMPAADVSPMLVRLEESDYTSVGMFLPDYLVKQIEDWYLVELVYCQCRPQLLGQYEVQLSLTHLHLKGCNCPHCWSWELHHIKSYSLDTDQLIVEVEGASDVWSGMFYFGSSGTHDDHITTLYHLLQQLMMKLYLVVMIKQQLIVTRKQLSAIMNHNQNLHSAIECFSCELLEGPSQDLLGHYTLQIFFDQIHVISNNMKWVWLLTELYSYKLDQEEMGGATYVTIETSNSTSTTMIEQWLWSGDHMIRFYSFLLELCQLLSQQSCQDILISQVVRIRTTTVQSITINTYTIQLTVDELLLIDIDSNQVICSYPLDCIKSLDLDEGKSELIICTNETPASKASELVIADDSAQKLLLLINKAVQNKQLSLHNAQQATHQSILRSQKPQLDTQQPSNNCREIVHQVSDEQVSVEGHKVGHESPLTECSQQTSQHHTVGDHQIPAADGPQQASVKTTSWYPLETHHSSLVDTTHEARWGISHQPQVAATEQEQEMVTTHEIKHQISSDAAKSTAHQSAEVQQLVSTGTQEVACHSSGGFQQIPEDSLTKTQQMTYEVIEYSNQVVTEAQEMTQQAQAQIQQKLLKLQQVSAEMETALQQTLKPQQEPKQNAYQLPVKLHEAKETTHETKQISKESQEQEHISTEPWEVMHQTSFDSQVSVITQEIIQPILCQPHTEHSSTADTLQTSHQIISRPVEVQQIPNEIQDERKHQLAVITQQTPCASDQTTFQVPEEEQVTDDEIIRQAQCVPMQSTEVECHYWNIQDTSTELVVVDTKQEITGTLETAQIPHHSTDRMDQRLLKTQKTSTNQPAADLEATPTETKTLDARPGGKNIIQGVQHMVGESINQPIKIHRTSTDVDQTCTLTETQEATQQFLLDIEQTTVEPQHQPQKQQPVETPKEITNLHSTIIKTQEITPYTTAQGSLEEAAQMVTSDNSRQKVQATTEDFTQPVKVQQLNEVKEITQAFSLAGAKQTSAEIESTAHQLLTESTITLPVIDEKIIHQLTKQTSIDAQLISSGPNQMSYQLSAETLKPVSDQQQTGHYHPVETQLVLDEANVAKYQHLPVDKTEHKQPQPHHMSVEGEVTMEQPADESLIKVKDSVQSHQYHGIAAKQASVEIQKAEHQADQLMVEMEQTMVKTIDYHLPVATELALKEHQQTVYEGTTAGKTHPKMLQEAKKDPTITTTTTTTTTITTTTKQSLNNPSQQISTETHVKFSSTSKTQQLLLPPGGDDDQWVMTELHKTYLQPLDEDHESPMKEETHCITSLDTQQTSNEADITDQSSILQIIPQISKDVSEILYQPLLDCEHTSRQCSSETHQVLDDVAQAVTHDALSKAQQTLATVDHPIQMKEPQQVSVEFDKISNPPFLTMPQELNEPIVHDEILMNTMLPALVQDVYHEVTQEASHETHQMLNETETKFNETQDGTKQIVHWPVKTEETPNDNTTTHNEVNNDQLSLVIQPIPDDTAKHQLPLASKQGLVEQCEAQETSCQLLQQVPFDMSQQLQAEGLLDEATEVVDWVPTLETQHTIPQISQQVLLESTEVTHRNLLKFEQTPCAIEPISINTKDQTEKNELQQITYYLHEDTEEHQQPFEKDVSINTAETAREASVGTTPQILPEAMGLQLVDTQQEASTDSHQSLTREAQEVSSLHMSNDAKEVTDEEPITSADKKMKDHFPFKANKTFTKSHKTHQFSVEVQELSIIGDSISCQPLVAKAQPEAALETQQMAIKKTCPLSLKAHQSVLHEISIDYKHRTVATRKTFYHTPTTSDEPHNFKHLFSVEAKEVLSEQLEPQEVSFKTQEITYQVSDELQPTVVESGQLEEEQKLAEPPRNSSHASNDTEFSVKTQEVITTVHSPTETHKNQPTMLPVQTRESEDQLAEAENQINPLLVEFDEEVVTAHFTTSSDTSNQATKDDFNIVTIIPSGNICHHYQLHANKNITSIGEEISTCTFRCCSYHILVKIEKTMQKKRSKAVSTSTPYHHCDLQATRKAIDELLLKYLYGSK